MYLHSEKSKDGKKKHLHKTGKLSIDKVCSVIPFTYIKDINFKIIALDHLSIACVVAIGIVKM